MNATLYDRMLSSVFEDGESEFKGTVSDFGLMRELIREYTHAGIAIMERRRHDMTPRYHKLQGFWCGDQSVKLFSPMDALSWPLGSSQLFRFLANRFFLVSSLAMTGKLYW